MAELYASDHCDNPFIPADNLSSVVWTFDTFENNFVINHRFTKSLKESCGLDFDQHFSFKYFLKIEFL